MKKKFRSLEITARRYLNTYSSGIHPTLVKDSLIEIDVVREYQPGDKRLDSKSSLKTGKSMSRVFNPERTLNLFIVLDISSSQYTKIDESVITALYLCYLGDICSEKIGTYVFSENFSKVVEASEDYSTVIGAIEKSLHTMQMDCKTNIEKAFKEVSRLFLTNSLVVLISDFCYPLSENLLNDIKRISLIPTNSFLNVVVYNPDDWLINISEKFSITFKDAETGKVGNYKIESANNEFNNWKNNIKSKLMKCNADTVFLDVKKENFLLPLVKYLMRN